MGLFFGLASAMVVKRPTVIIATVEMLFIFLRFFVKDRERRKEILFALIVIGDKSLSPTTFDKIELTK